MAKGDIYNAEMEIQISKRLWFSSNNGHLVIDSDHPDNVEYRVWLHIPYTNCRFS